MSRRPAASGGTTVSLFPFLAVLLCTIGALILLLVVIARQSRSDAEQATKRAAAAPAIDFAEVRRESEDLEWQVEQMSGSWKKTSELLAQQRAQLSHLEEHAQRLREEIKQWDEAQRQLAERTTLDAAAKEKLRAELAELKRRAAEAEAKLAEVKGRVKRKAFAVVPYDGQNGTRRRPIYIECRGDSITLQPEGIVFTENDFSGSLGPSNALAACVRATAEHYARSGSLQPGEQPYPLLLVRPDGVMAYYVARAAMNSWDSEFGYELVDAEWSLDYPAVDPQLRQMLVNVQNEARQRQEMIARSAPSLRQAERPSFRAMAGGDGSGDSEEGLPGSGGGGAGRGGNGSGNGGAGYGGGGATDAPYVAPRGYVAESSGVVGTPVGSGSGQGMGNGQGFGTGSNASPNGAGGGYGGQPGAAGPGGPQLGTPDGSPGGGLAQGGGFPAGGGSGPYAGGGGQAGTNGQFAGNGQPSGNGQPPGNGQPGGTGSGTGSGDGPYGSGNAGGAGGGASGGNANGSGGNSSGTPGSNNDPNANRYGGSGTTDSSIASAGGGQSGFGQAGLGGGAGGGSSAGGQAGGSGGSGGSSGGGSGGSSSGGMGGGGSSGGSSGGGAAGSSGNDNTASGSMVQDNSSAAGNESLAKKRGKDWSLPDAARKKTAVARPVQVYCSVDRLTILSDRNIPDKQINFEARTSNTVDQLVKTVWDQVETWGIAGRGMYWRPTLSVHYAPDGEARFNELRTLLAGSGLEVVGKPIQVAAPATSIYERR